MSVRNVFHLSVRNYIGDYTLGADVSAETAYPLTNLQNQNSDEPTVFDMGSDTEVTIQGTSATERTVNCICLWNHNMPNDNTVRLRLYPEESYGGTPYDTTALPAHTIIPWGAFLPMDPWGQGFEDVSKLKKCFLLFFDEVAFKSFQLTVGAPTSTDDLLSIDKIWLGPAYAFDYGYAHGSRFQVVDPSEHIRKPNGGMETVERQCYRAMQLEFNGMTDAESILVTNLLDYAKKGGDLLVSCDPNHQRGHQFRRSGIFRRTNDTDFTSRYFNGLTFGLALEEN